MAGWDWLIPSAGVDTSKDIYNTPQGQQVWGDISGLSQYNLGGQNLGQFQGLTQQGIANPFAAGFQTGAGVAGGMGQQAGTGQFQAGQGLMQQGAGFAPDVQRLIEMGFDPQQALYNRTAQQVRDQNAAAAASSGVAGTPYGAGVANMANANFNIDWQNQELARAAQGANAAGNLATTGANIQGAGAELERQGVNSYMLGSSLPYQTAGQINQNQLALLNQANAYGQQAAAIPQMQIQDKSGLLRDTQAAQDAVTKNQMQQARDEFSQAQTVGQDVAGLATMGMGMGTGFMGGMGMGGGAGRLSGGMMGPGGAGAPAGMLPPGWGPMGMANQSGVMGGGGGYPGFPSGMGQWGQMGGPQGGMGWNSPGGGYGGWASNPYQTFGYMAGQGLKNWWGS